MGYISPVQIGQMLVRQVQEHMSWCVRAGFPWWSNHSWLGGKNSGLARGEPWGGEVTPCWVCVSLCGFLAVSDNELIFFSVSGLCRFQLRGTATLLEFYSCLLWSQRHIEATVNEQRHSQIGPETVGAEMWVRRLVLNASGICTDLLLILRMSWIFVPYKAKLFPLRSYHCQGSDWASKLEDRCFDEFFLPCVVQYFLSYSVNQWHFQNKCCTHQITCYKCMSVLWSETKNGNQNTVLFTIYKLEAKVYLW